MMGAMNNMMMTSTNNDDIGGVGGATGGRRYGQASLSSGGGGRGGGSRSSSSDSVSYVPGGGHLGPYLGEGLPPPDPCDMCEKLSVKLNTQLDANHSRNACPNKQQYDDLIGSEGFGNEFGM